MPGIDIDQLKLLIIRPTLTKLGLWSLSAENLLIGTCLIESNGGQFLKQIVGPALGIYQMEPITHDDIWNNYLIFNPQLTKLMPSHHLEHYPQMMMWDLYYATTMARIHYFRVKEPLPKENDIIGLSLYWKTYFNTHLGKGDPVKFQKLLGVYLNGIR